MDGRRFPAVGAEAESGAVSPLESQTRRTALSPSPPPAPKGPGRLPPPPAQLELLPVPGALSWGTPPEQASLPSRVSPVNPTGSVNPGQPLTTGRQPETSGLALGLRAPAGCSVPWGPVPGALGRPGRNSPVALVQWGPEPAPTPSVCCPDPRGVLGLRTVVLGGGAGRGAGLA